MRVHLRVVWGHKLAISLGCDSGDSVSKVWTVTRIKV